MIFSNSNIVEEGFKEKAKIFSELYKYNFVKMYLPDLSLYRIDKKDDDFINKNKSEILNKAKSAKSFIYNGYKYNVGGFTMVIQTAIDNIPAYCQPGLVDLLFVTKDEEKLRGVYMKPEDFKKMIYSKLFAKKGGESWDSVKEYLITLLHGGETKKKDLPLNQLYIPQRVKQIESDTDKYMDGLYKNTEKNIKFMQKMYDDIISEASKKKNVNPTRVKHVDTNIKFLSDLNVKLYKLALSVYKEVYNDYMSSCKQLLAYKPSKENYSILDEAMSMV